MLLVVYIVQCSIQCYTVDQGPALHPLYTLC